MENTAIDYLEEYTQKIFNKEIIAGVELKRMLLKLKKEKESGKYIYDNSYANMRIAFMETFCKQRKKPYHGVPISLMLWQKAFFTALYSFYRKDENGNKTFLRFEKAMLLIARKNGKSTMVSADGFTQLALGKGEDIICGSNDDKQAMLIWKEIQSMSRKFEKTPKRFHSNLTEVRNNYNENSVTRMSSRTRDKDGRNCTKVYLDEIHNAIDDELYMALWQSMSTNDERLLVCTTTEGFVNDGLLDKELKYIRQILSDEVEDDSYLAFLYTQDSENEIFEDEKTWIKSNPSLGTIKKFSYLRGNIQKAKQIKTDRIHIMCKDFNIHQNSAQSFLAYEDYTYNAKFDIEDLRGCYGIAGVDLSATTDMTACKVIVKKPNDKTKYVIQKYWIPERKLIDSDDKNAGAKYEEWARIGILEICEGNEIPVDNVADWLYSLYSDYGIIIFKCGYDVRLSKVFKNRMIELFGEEVLEVIPQSAKVLSSPTKLMEVDLKSKIVNYNENEIDRWCFSNAQVKVNERGEILVVKLKDQASRRIDGCVALIIAYATLGIYRTEYEELYA